jgi:3-oxoacyl-[acyl-carrier-protein] synthase-3
MRWTDMYIAATGSCIPELEDVAPAVAEGRYDAEEATLNDYVSVAVSHELSAPDMAVAAARTALDRCAEGPGEMALVLHAYLTHQGLDHWTPASYIQDRTIGGRAPSMEVKQGSNGSLAALTMGMAYLAGTGGSAALITTADRFYPPMYDRFRSDKWFIWGDGASALVLSRKGGFARVLSSASDADPGLEGVYRLNDSFTDAPGTEQPLDLRERKRDFAAYNTMEDVVSRISAGVLNVVKTALDDAGTGLEDIARFVFPNVGKFLLYRQMLDVLGVEEERTTHSWARTVGHIGAGDQLGGLNHLAESGTLRPGDRVAVIGNGIGFNWTCVVLEILEAPAWPDRA